MRLLEILQQPRVVVATARFSQDLTVFCGKNPAIQDKLARFLAFRRDARPDQQFSHKDEPFQAAKSFRRCHLIHGTAILFYQLTNDELRLAALVDHDAMESQSMITYLARLDARAYTPVTSIACQSAVRSGPAKAGQRVQAKTNQPLDRVQQQLIQDLLRGLVHDDRVVLQHASQGDPSQFLLWARESLDVADDGSDAAILGFLDGPAGLARKAKVLLKLASRQVTEAADELPETTWADIQTGVPARFSGWRGINGPKTPLSDHIAKYLGREWLLGDGIYVAPTKHMAVKYGYPVRCQIFLHNPYAVRIAPKTGWLWAINQLDLATIRQTHDGIVIVAGKTNYREDLRQAVIFADLRIKCNDFKP